MAALEDGQDVQFELFPQGSDPEALDTRPVAVCRFSAAQAAPDPLFAHVPVRRSLKEPFDMTRTVSAADLSTITAAAIHGSAASGSVDPEEIARMRALTSEALRIEVETPRTYRESVDLFRIGRREVDASPDGIDFTGPLFEGLSRVGMFNREIVLDTSSTAFQQGMSAVLENAETAMGHVWQVTPTNTRADQIRAGRDWVRINLAATGLGIGTQPLSQALQEYPEMQDLYTDVHRRLAPGGGTVQMLARLGYGPDVSASPRWPLEEKIV